MTDQQRRVRRRGPAWVRLAQGVHRPAEASNVFLTDLHAWAERLPDGAVFTGLTAARLRGLWVPPVPADLPVFVAVPRSATHSKRAQVVVSRETPSPRSELVDGLRVAPVPETLLACARDLGILDLVVLVDSALHFGLCTVADLRAVAAPRRKGAPRLRRAIDHADARSESPYETLLRLLHLACEVPVEPQPELHDDTGVFLGRADLRIRGTTTLQEYDGADHQEKVRYRTDRRRDRRLSAAGFTRNGYVDADLLARGISILRDADRALGRPHDPARIRVWHDLLRDSLFSAAGTARLRRRCSTSTAEVNQKVCSGAGNEPSFTSAAYARAPSRSVARRSAYCLTKRGIRPERSPKASCHTSTWPSQPLPAPMPMVVMVSSSLIRSATSPGTISMTTANAPASATARASATILSAASPRPWTR